MSELSINANNKIIDRDLLIEIFDAMREELEKCQRIADEEKAKNEPLKSEFQEWTLRFFSGSINCTIYFTDNHSVNYDDYRTFMSVLKNQPFSIRHLIVNYTMSYNLPTSEDRSGKHMHNSIQVSATEDRFGVNANLASGDQYMQPVYDLITQKIAAAPPKYDRLIKAKELINFKIGFAMGLIPATVAVAATLFVPQLHDFYNKYFILFPALVLLLAVAFGIFLGSMKTASSYAKIVPKKYGGYDSNTRSSYYNDDISKLTETSDVLIGNKSNNMVERKKIIADEKRYSKVIPIFLGVAAVVTLIAFFLTR